jgi:hypothetical protein
MRELVVAIMFCAVPLLGTAVSAEPVNPEGAPQSCLGRGITDPASDKLNAWGENSTRVGMLEKVRQLAEAGGIKSLLALEIGLAGTYSIYNSVWLVETSSGIKSFIVETPEKESKLPESRELTIDSTAYALLWSELEDLRAWDTPSDAKTVGLRADVPVFTATFCRDGRLHRVRIENPPLPTWGKDDSFEQARRRHDKKAREFMLRPRDRAIEAMRLIQAF